MVTTCMKGPILKLLINEERKDHMK